MSFLDFVTWAALACLPLFIALDLVYKARQYDTPRFWRVRALAVTLLAIALSFALPMAWAKVIGDFAIFQLSALGTWWGALVGILVYEFCHYWYHRSVHRSDFLFRAFHQMHHSSESLDAWSAYYIAPTDAAMFISIGTLVFGPLLGLAPEAAAVANLFLTFNAFFQHANIRTPAWIGYIIQRPESHGVHHERGVHRYNYSDLPLWDMLFGTFENPRQFDQACGFGPEREVQLPAMLLGRDVNAPRRHE